MPSQTVYVQATGSESATGGSITGTMTVTAGDLLIVAAGGFASSAPTFGVSDTQSNTWSAQGSVVHNNRANCQMWTAVASASGSVTITLTMNSPTEGLTGIFADFSSPDGSTPTTSTSSTGLYPLTVPNLTVNTGTWLLLYAFYNEGASFTSAVTQDIIIAANQTNTDAETLGFAYRFVTCASSTTYGGEVFTSVTGGTGASSVLWALAIAAYPCSGGSGSTPTNYGFVG